MSAEIINQLKSDTTKMNQEHLEDVNKDKECYEELIFVHSFKKDNKKNNDRLELIKMFYKKNIIERVFMEHLINYDYKNALVYKKKLDEIFVDLDMLTSEVAIKENNYKEVTDDLMRDKEMWDAVLEINKMYHDYTQNSKI